MAVHLNMAEVKARLFELVNRVAFRQERLIILKRGKPVAALVSLEDLRHLEALEANDVSHPDRHPVSRAFGGWADREDLDELVE